MMTHIFWLADAVLKLFFKGRQALFLENVALRQQLATYKQIGRRPRIRTADRVFWIWISKLWNNWRTPLIIVKPQTVIRWHRQGFRLYWRRKSTAKKIGRPTISRRHIDFIRRMSRDYPRWGEDKIFEELHVKFGVAHSTSTIRKYMVKPRRWGDRQIRRTFIRNYGEEIFACDFMIQYTAFFTDVYVFVVMEIKTQRIVHFNATTNPTLEWVKHHFKQKNHKLVRMKALETSKAPTCTTANALS